MPLFVPRLLGDPQSAALATRTTTPRPRVSGGLVLAALLWGPACSGGSPEASAAPDDAPTATLGGTGELARAPLPEDTDGLDPAALELVRRAAAEVDADARRPEPWTRLGMAFHANRRFELARTCYAQRLLRDPEDARTWYRLALVEDQLGETDRAIAQLEESSRLAPSYAPAHWRRGLLHLRRGELERAEECMRSALAIAPHDAAAVVGMARVRLQQGRPADAAALLEEHLERLPRDGNARFLLGTAYRNLGRTEEAARTLGAGAGGDPVWEDPWEAEVVALRRGYRTEFFEAVDLLAAGKVQRAIAILEELHRRQPDDTLIHINLHRAYRMNGELDRAIALLREAREIDPLLDVVYLHLAGALRDKARESGESPDRTLLQSALESIERACELSPTYADAHGLRGDVLSDLGEVERATDAYARAANLDHDSVMWNEKAGLALCQAGRWEEAVPLLRRLDVLQPGSKRTLFLLSAALANSGHLEEARGSLEAARRLAPDDPVILKAIGDLDRKLHDGGEGGR